MFVLSVILQQILPPLTEIYYCMYYTIYDYIFLVLVVGHLEVSDVQETYRSTNTVKYKIQICGYMCADSDLICIRLLVVSLLPVRCSM